METGYFGGDRVERIHRERVQKRWAEAYAPIKHLDPILIGTALLLAVVGLVAIYSARYEALNEQGLPATYYVARQAVAMVVALGAMVVAAVVDYRHLRSYLPLLYGGSLILLVAVLFLGVERGGATRWIEVAGFQLQPSEVAKVAVIVTLAALLAEHQEHLGAREVGLGLVLVAVPMGLVFLEPDLGTSLVFVWLTATMFLVGGVPARWLIGLAVTGIGGLTALLASGIYQFEAYQLERLTAFMSSSNPSLALGPRWNLEQSLIAIGSGQFAGKGYLEGTQTSLSYVPENHTDFIFTVIGEEFGFMGGAAVLALFAVLLWRGLRIATLAKDRFGMLLATGAVAMLALQVFINVGMTLGIMPVTGIPLPFVSYGGTSLIVWFAITGLLLNVHMRRF
ncbi:rod shape-determining protein RodA [Nitriliruptoraceae bacterium ZYF776]|nr:rod shape-determining protein RodA [Profundirhabdus halotolerans]